MILGPRLVRLLKSLAGQAGRSLGFERVSFDGDLMYAFSAANVAFVEARLPEPVPRPFALPLDGIQQLMSFFPGKSGRIELELELCGTSARIVARRRGVGKRSGEGGVDAEKELELGIEEPEPRPELEIDESRMAMVGFPASALSDLARSGRKIATMYSVAKLVLDPRLGFVIELAPETGAISIVRYRVKTEVDARERVEVRVDAEILSRMLALLGPTLENIKLLAAPGAPLVLESVDEPRIRAYIETIQ